MFVFRAAVVGAGTMGGEIAHAIAAAGIPVVLKDVDPERVDQGLARARSLWQAQVDAGKLDRAGLDAAMARIEGTVDYGSLRDVDFVIEAVPEQMELKRTVFAQLDEATPGHAILASNTSALSITEIGEGTLRPDKVVGFHFFYPVSSTRAVEVVEGIDTSTETAQAAASFAQAIRRVPLRCADSPGFAVNRVLNAAVSEWWRAQEESGMAIEEFDAMIAAVSPSGAGPFLIADVLGLDTVLAVAQHLRESLGDRFHVHDAMRSRVAAGELGVKSGKGFYEHGG